MEKVIVGDRGCIGRKREKLVAADGSSIDLTITCNNPFTNVCGTLGMDININSSERASGLNVEPL